MFTQDEWPERNLLENDGFSIGEEQSYSIVTALAWSPAALAKHRRSALAVLTSNHVLSLWASNSDMAVSSSWERVLIINSLFHQRPLPVALTGIRPGNELVDNEESPSSRVQSISWAPLLSLKDTTLSENANGPDNMELAGDLRTASGANTVQSRAQPTLFVEDVPDDMSLTPETQLLAVANDCGNIYIIEVFSQYINHSQSWGGNIVHVFSAFSTQPVADAHSETRSRDNHTSSELLEMYNPVYSKNRRPSLFAAAYRSKTIINSILWSPWRVFEGNGSAEATVTTTRAGATSHTRLLVSSTYGDIKYQSAGYKRIGEPLELSPSTAIWCRIVNQPSQFANLPNFNRRRTRARFLHILAGIDSALLSRKMMFYAIYLRNPFLLLITALVRTEASPLRLRLCGIRSMVCIRSRS